MNFSTFNVGSQKPLSNEPSIKQFEQSTVSYCTNNCILAIMVLCHIDQVEKKLGLIQAPPSFSWFTLAYHPQVLCMLLKALHLCKKKRRHTNEEKPNFIQMSFLLPESRYPSKYRLGLFFFFYIACSN